MHNIEGPAKLLNVIDRLGVEISQTKLHNGWRINDTAVALPKAASTCGDGLLTDPKNVTI